MQVSQPPPSNRRPRFQTVAKSRVMRHMLTTIASRATDERITPFIIGDNTVELASGIATILQRRSQTATCLMVNTPQDAKKLHHKNFTTAVFMGAAAVSEDIQDCFVAGLLSHVKGAIAVIDRNPLKTSTHTHSMLRCLGWQTDFMDGCCARSIEWPAWKDRRADHVQIFAQLFSSKKMPHDVRKPPFDDELIQLLREITMLQGSDHANQLLNRAISRYIADERSGAGNGRLLGRHIIDADEIREASTPRAPRTTDQQETAIQ